MRGDLGTVLVDRVCSMRYSLASSTNELGESR